MQTVATQTPANAFHGNTSNAAAQSTPAELPLDVIIQKAMIRKNKNGVIRSQFNCNRSQLFSAVCAEVKSARGMESNARLSNEVAEQINEAIDLALVAKITSVTPTNVTSVTTSFRHKFSQLAVVEQVKVIGINILGLYEQHEGINALLKQAKARLAALEAKYADREIIDNTKKSIMRLDLTKANIDAQIEEHKKLAAEKK